MNPKSEGAFDLISLGALVHRLDPGIMPIRKAIHCGAHTGPNRVAVYRDRCQGVRAPVVFHDGPEPHSAKTRSSVPKPRRQAGLRQLDR